MRVCLSVMGSGSVVLIGASLSEVNGQHINYTIGKCAISFLNAPFGRCQVGIYDMFTALHF